MRGKLFFLIGKCKIPLLKDMKNKIFPAQNEILCSRDSEGGRENSPFMKKQREGG